MRSSASNATPPDSLQPHPGRSIVLPRSTRVSSFVGGCIPPALPMVVAFRVVGGRLMKSVISY